MRAQQEVHSTQDDGDASAENRGKCPDEGVHEKHHTLDHLKRDVEKMFMLTRQSFRGSMDSLISKLSPPRSPSTSFRLSRRLKVEFVNASLSDDSSDEDEFSLDHPDHNYSPNLVLGLLKDGQFRAKIPLDDLPHGDITLRVRNYLLEIVMTRGDCHATCDRHHLVTKPCKYGEIDLPIYVNPASLSFHVDELTNVLHMHGQTKGYNKLCYSDPSIDKTHERTGHQFSWPGRRRKLLRQKRTTTFDAGDLSVDSDEAVEGGSGRGNTAEQRRVSQRHWLPRRCLTMDM
ncbi:hypothetical protein NP493_137g03027 [Ridgeia piscesae]|uniref:Uncharacterized protein n=1 Tax=Ridgeia piscesae TaxID=27915 RepID=A0AAD9P518_RIDPI|nr:hypothetical protein NP493_137g03027 [Ridgeia piscesae]